jgi:hypothetical protein
MKCPHCSINFHDNWEKDQFSRDMRAFSTDEGDANGCWYYRTAICPGCNRATITIGRESFQGYPLMSPRQVYPIGASRGPVPPEVPSKIAEDYIEACNVLPISPKASAALSRRCLQNILHAHGYRDRDLAKEIDLLLNETDPRKALPLMLQETIDGVRNFGNFSAHPIDDKTSLQVIDVEEHEAEWCLEILEECFQHFYVGPAMARIKKAALNTKLAAANKPLAK